MDEFELPSNIIDRKVRKMKMISPTGKEVDIGGYYKPDHAKLAAVMRPSETLNRIINGD